MVKYLSFVLFIVLSACSVNKQTAIQEPKLKKSDNYVTHSSYSLVFNQNTKQADWVAYKLAYYQLDKNYTRKNKFTPDTVQSIVTATNNDYKKSGYDRGHLVPAADRIWNEQALEETFLFSNISPQLPSFNRGVWKSIEEQTRVWAELYDSIYICTGPYFENTDISIGENVTVPTHFYKTILVYNDTIQQAVAFFFPHSNITDDFLNYSAPIDSIEQILKIDLYHLLPNKVEKRIEETVDRNFWK